jgi:hypothetical protein
MLRKELVFKFIKNPLRRGVPVGIDLIQDHFLLFPALVEREGAVKGYIGKELQGPGVVFLEKAAIQHSFFLAGVGIKLAAYVFHPA